jgi:hypothetical protein
MSTDGNTAARRLFYPAAAYNFTALPFLVDAKGASQLIGMTPVPTDVFWVHGVAAIIILFGGFYAMAGFDPVRYRLYIPTGIIAKLLFVAVVYWHFLVAGDISWHMAAVAAGDAVWLFLFWLYLKQHPAADTKNGTYSIL